MRVFSVLFGVLWVWVFLATGAWSAKRITTPMKKRGSKPTSMKASYKDKPKYGWCKTRHTPRKPAQSGHLGYCKACYKKKFPRKFAIKKKTRSKPCPYCGNQRELTVAGFCKPCTKSRSCKSCSAVNVNRYAPICSMCFKRRSLMGATQAALALWCEACTTPEQRCTQLCQGCFDRVPTK